MWEDSKGKLHCTREEHKKYNHIYRCNKQLMKLVSYTDFVFSCAYEKQWELKHNNSLSIDNSKKN